MPRHRVDQLELFARDAPAPGADANGELRELGECLPANVRFGTSSWTFPGWAGLVYHRRYESNAAFLRDSLAEYARFPLFRAVGVDRSYYGPLTTAQWHEYAEQVPPTFRFAAKVWEELVTHTFPRHPRYGVRAGTTNSRFLDAALFEDLVLRPYVDGLGATAGPLVLEFPKPPVRVPPREFVERLDRFLGARRSDLPLAVELRERAWLTDDYVALLRAHGISHVWTFWSAMPSLGDQWARTRGPTAAHVVIRLLLAPGARYEDEKARFAPFDRVVAPQPAMRDDVAAIVEAVAERASDVYVLVNNKAEGSAPGTIEALARRIARAEQGAAT